jgi:hypothetical protein
LLYKTANLEKVRESIGSKVDLQVGTALVVAENLPHGCNQEALYEIGDTQGKHELHVHWEYDQGLANKITRAGRILVPGPDRENRSRDNECGSVKVPHTNRSFTHVKAVCLKPLAKSWMVGVGLKSGHDWVPIDGLRCERAPFCR